MNNVDVDGYYDVSWLGLGYLWYFSGLGVYPLVGHWMLVEVIPLKAKA